MSDTVITGLVLVVISGSFCLWSLAMGRFPRSTFYLDPPSLDKQPGIFWLQFGIIAAIGLFGLFLISVSITSSTS
jgi:hypothetical protein